MIFNMAGASGKRPFLPQYTGKSRIVFLGNGSAGYMEFYTSGTLTWLDGKHPEKVDAFCVGGGSGGANGTYYTAENVTYGGGGGGGGYTNTVFAALLPDALEIAVGAGGMNGHPGSVGGTTSVGALCSANGGASPTALPPFTHYGYRVGGSGGSAGGNGGRGYNNEVYTLRHGGKGGSNGGPPVNVETGSGSDAAAAGISQGTPTTDLLGRIHAGGGGGGRGWYTNGGPQIPGNAGVGGASDFADGSGKPPSDASASTGGGGFGGGGAGGPAASSNTAGGVGGDGFAMIAWGDYSPAIEE